jgi:hypothetical protein
MPSVSGQLLDHRWRVEPTRKVTGPLSGKGPLVAEEEKERKLIEVTDRYRSELAVGDVVSVVQQVKAFQVPPNGRGRFDENRQFVPLSEDEDTGRPTRHLVVPVGMKGVVTKLHVEANLSANFRIQVKFTPGEDCNAGGYDPPVPFVMHFASDEVEVVTNSP